MRASKRILTCLENNLVYLRIALRKRRMSVSNKMRGQMLSEVSMSGKQRWKEQDRLKDTKKKEINFKVRYKIIFVRNSN